MNDSVPNMKTLNEARQEAAEYGENNASVGNKNTRALEQYYQEHPEMKEFGDIY